MDNFEGGLPPSNTPTTPPQVGASVSSFEGISSNSGKSNEVFEGMARVSESPIKPDGTLNPNATGPEAADTIEQVLVGQGDLENGLQALADGEVPQQDTSNGIDTDVSSNNMEIKREETIPDIDKQDDDKEDENGKKLLDRQAVLNQLTAEISSLKNELKHNAKAVEELQRVQSQVEYMKIILALTLGSSNPMERKNWIDIIGDVLETVNDALNYAKQQAEVSEGTHS
jgi:hypothetical protein